MNLRKLVTKEDPYHFHKFFGIACLLNFVYQYCHYFIYGSMFKINYLIFFHLFLHLTSFIFRVIKERPINPSVMNMFIWEELRIHSMIFAYRACFVILFPQYCKYITFSTLILADIASYYFGNPNNTTVRGNHDKVSNSAFKNIASIFFSTSQMGATLICSGCSQSFPSDILTFSTLPPIQTSAFGLTLLRKNIINKKIWQIIYSLELLLVYILWIKVYKNYYIIPLSILPYFLRRIGFSKYIIWLFIFYLDYKNYVKEMLIY